MKKVVVAVILGAFLVGGVIMTNNDSRIIASGGEKEPSVLSTRSVFI